MAVKADNREGLEGEQPQRPNNAQRSEDLSAFGKSKLPKKQAASKNSTAPKTHSMYVLECVDGSLYTGYSTDVAARVKKHQAGKGAKYTRTHLPVNLLAVADFPTKHLAMSAEYHFKKLSRDDKDALLAACVHRPLADLLLERFPQMNDKVEGETL